MPSPLSTDPTRTAWHALDADDALRRLATTRDGLAGDEAVRRLAADGPNRLPAAPRRGPLARFLLQFHNLLIYVLVVAAVVTFALGHVADTAVILGVVLANAIIGFVQEGKAEQALDAIRGMIDPTASVLRDGRRLTVPAHAIVRGDVVLVEAGDRVPADLRLLRARQLRVDEAILTGESVPVEKGIAPLAAGAPLGDRACMLYSGTFVAAGQGAGLAVETAGHTELGRISALLGEVRTLKTPLLAQMDGFARRLTLAILALAVGVFVFAVQVRGYAFGDAFMVVVGIAVAAIPEGLPAILTIALAIGVQRMARRNAIIRRLPAVETLGAVSVICSDKTGTLTRNEMTATDVAAGDGHWQVGGVGYAPEGDFDAGGRVPDPLADPVLAGLLRAAVLCNDAALRRDDATWVVDGDPMEGALMVLGAKAGIDADRLRRDLPRTDEIPFDARHRFMATLHHAHDDGSFIVVKGAPERILEMCSREACAGGERPLDVAAWQSRAESLAAAGRRVLAFARKRARTGQQDLAFDDVDGDACLLGCVGFIDPPRPAAVEAVAECRAAGVRVVMITGDHAATAGAIARELGLAPDPVVVAGRDLDAMDDAALRDATVRAQVFARTTPEHKLRLVEALQAQGLAVAMTGDGVNDAPALKRADVGVAMGRKGTEAAKEAAEVVLADDNFASIVAAVREGRTVYDNVLKVISWTLPTNGGEAMTIVAAIALGMALPITPLQILWVNMVTAVALGLALAFEPTEPGAMRRPPRPRDQPLLTRDLVWRIGFVSLLFVAGCFGMFWWAESRGLPLETARTLVVNTLVAMEVFYLFSVRYVHGSALTLRGVLGTPAVLWGVAAIVLLQAAFTWLPPLQRVFDTRAITAGELLAVVAIGIGVLLAAEAEKRLRLAIERRWAASRRTPR